MRFPLTGFMLLVLCAPVAAEPYTLKIPSWRNMARAGVEKAFPVISLENLSCRVDTYRLEQAAVNLERKGYEAVSQREQRFFSGTYRLTTWRNAKTGTRADLLHRYDGSTCVWDVYVSPTAVANGAAEPKNPP